MVGIGTPPFQGFEASNDLDGLDCPAMLFQHRRESLGFAGGEISGRDSVEDACNDSGVIGRTRDCG